MLAVVWVVYLWSQPPTHSGLEQQSFYCSGIWAGSSVFVVSAVVTGDAWGLAGAGLPRLAPHLGVGVVSPLWTPVLWNVCLLPFHVVTLISSTVRILFLRLSHFLIGKGK